MKIQTIKHGIAVITISVLFFQSNQAYGQSQEDRKQQGPPSYAQLLTKMDTNKDGLLAKNEVKGPLKKDFSRIDANEDGYISEEELKNAPKPQGERPPIR
ncbi:MAG: EF-hand domain-containing protein [Salibacteraceae bacterium]